MSYGVGVAMCPDEASKPEETVQRGKYSDKPLGA
jgi:hypothetical protein